MRAFRVRTKQAKGFADDIPDKLYFKIGEVAQLVGVASHVLRYWEKGVSAIRPGKSASNQRRYRRRDVELFREIRRLLYEEKFTLAGARKRLTAGDPAGVSTSVSAEPDNPFSGDPDLVQLPETEILSPTPDPHPGPLPFVVSGSPLEVSPRLVTQLAKPAKAPELTSERLERVKAGLRELIRLAGG